MSTGEGGLGPVPRYVGLPVVEGDTTSSRPECVNQLVDESEGRREGGQSLPPRQARVGAAGSVAGEEEAMLRDDPAVGLEGLWQPVANACSALDTIIAEVLSRA